MYNTLIRLFTGVERIGTIESVFDKDFDFGHSARSRYNSTLGKTVHGYDFEVEIVFGNKGGNLTFRCLVDGKETASAVLKFNR